MPKQIQRRVDLSNLLLIPTIFTSILHSLPASAYVPALPVNDTSRMNLTDASTIAISWSMPAGVFSGPVSFQLQADIPTNGSTSGALVHFTESTMGPNLTSSTPWIAYISCDANETGASMEWDVFTLARDRGAVSALLYSPTAQSCLLNQEYILEFEKPLDVFATETLQVARVIDSQFTHTNATFYSYNGTLLNATGSAVNSSIAGQTLQEQSFLIGTVTAANSTGQASPTSIPGGGNSPPSTDSGSKKQPSGMIALYVITGCILAMFVLMIFLAIRRAIRHPERYGRRDADENQAAQTRTQGIAQALLDTFPVIKFNRHAGQNQYKSQGQSQVQPQGLILDQSRRTEEGGMTSPRPKTVGSELTMAESDTRARMSSLEYGEKRSSRLLSDTSMSGVGLLGSGYRQSIAMKSLHTDDHRGGGAESYEDQDDVSVKSLERSTSSNNVYPMVGSIGIGNGNRQRSGTNTSLPSGSGSGSGSASATGSRRTSRHELAPPILNTGLTEMPGEMEEQCPICLLDFEEGEDLRVLPCEKEHVYHQSCIDPWLLNVSSSCPLCRKDFNLSASTEPTNSSNASANQPPTASGFAKYLAFMRRERRPSSTHHAHAHGDGSRRRAGTGASGSGRSGTGRERDDSLGSQAGPGPFP